MKFVRIAGQRISERLIDRLYYQIDETEENVRVDFYVKLTTGEVFQISSMISSNLDYLEYEKELDRIISEF